MNNTETTRDVADTPLAAEEADVTTGEPGYALVEELRMCPDGVTPEQEAVILEWFDSGGGGGGNKDLHGALVEILFMFTENRDARVLAWAFLLLIGKCPYSGEEVARKCGHTRASFSKIKRELEVRLGLRCRVHRGEESIEHSRQLCIDRGPRRTKGETWKEAKRLQRGLGVM